MKNSFKVLFENDDVVVVEKAAGLLSVPDRFDLSLPSLQALLKNRFEQIFTVHRLDKDTSGVIVFAKSEESHRSLNKQFEERTIDKTYIALTHGVPPCPYTIKTGIVKSKSKSIMIVDTKSEDCTTHIKNVEKFGQYSVVELQLETGKTHQLRLHLSYLGHPIIADPKYGDGKPLSIEDIKKHKLNRKEQQRPLIHRTALHAYQLNFSDPSDINRRLSFTAEYPKDFRATINQLRKWKG